MIGTRVAYKQRTHTVASQLKAYAALGCQITRTIRAEVGYRYLYEDFRDESASDFLYQLSLHGVPSGRWGAAPCNAAWLREDRSDPNDFRSERMGEKDVLNPFTELTPLELCDGLKIAVLAI